MTTAQAETASALPIFWSVADEMKRGGFDLSRDPDGLDVAKGLWLEAVLTARGLVKLPPPDSQPPLPDADADDDDTLIED